MLRLGMENGRHKINMEYLAVPKKVKDALKNDGDMLK